MPGREGRTMVGGRGGGGDWMVGCRGFLGLRPAPRFSEGWVADLMVIVRGAFFVDCLNLVRIEILL